MKTVRELDEEDGLIVFDRCSDLGAVPQRRRKVIARRLEIVDFERDVDVADWIVELRCRPLCSQLGAIEELAIDPRSACTFLVE